MRTMKQSIFNRTHRTQSKSSSPIALIMPKRSDHSRTHFHYTCVVGLFRAHCCMRTFATQPNRTIAALAQRALLRSFPQHLPQIPPQQARTGRRGPNHVPILQKWQKFAVVNGLSTPKRPQRCFVFTKPQVTIYRRQEQCTPYRAQPQICAKKLTIRTKYQARANCSRRHQQ